MYKKIFYLLCIFVATTGAGAKAQDADPNMGIIPAPVSIKNSKRKLCFKSAENRNTGLIR